MNRSVIAGALLAVGIAFGAAANEACAQYRAGVSPFGGRADNPVGPTVSPYLNLLQTNNQGFVPYQSLVRPLIENRNAIQTQGAAIARLQQDAYTGAPAGGITGHQTFFGNLSHFYPQRGR